MYYGWSKEFLEPQARLRATRPAPRLRREDLRREANALKEVVAVLTLENPCLKKA